MPARSRSDKSQETSATWASEVTTAGNEIVDQGQVTFAEEAAISSWPIVGPGFSREEDLSTGMKSRGVLSGIHCASP